MDQQQRELIKKYLDILLFRKKIIITGLLLGIAVGLGIYLKSTKIYQCTSLIQYQRQRINPTAMSPDDIKSRPKEVVSSVSQKVTSRTNLESIIKEFNLYPGMRAVMPIEDVIEFMRESSIKITAGKGETFKVSFQGREPRKVLLVTNTLAAKFIEENLRFREERVSETLTYVEDELRMSKEALDKKDAVMRDYKLKHYNEMSGQLNNNMSRLNALSQQYQHNQNSSQDLERTRIMVQEQVSLREEILAQRLKSTAPLGADLLKGEGLGVVQLRQKLQTLQLRYTANHPEVKRVKKMLQEFEKNQKAGDGESGSLEEDSGESEATLVSPVSDLQTEQLKAQLKDLEYNIDRLKKDRQKIKSEIEKYQKWVEAAPVREAEWSALTRDYKQFNEHYQALVARNIQAESAESLERRLQGSQFKIIDPAHLPVKPFQPDFRKIMLLALGIGLGVGGAIAFGLDLLGNSFKDPTTVETYLDVPVVCAVPKILTQKELARQKIMQVLWSILLIVSVSGLLGVFVYFWKQGRIIL